MTKSFFKGPITSCEYINDSSVLIGCGPYLSLIDEATFNEKTRFLALKYRVIHKILKSPQNPNLICVFGQKALNIVLYENERFTSSIPKVIEFKDWIFDVHWYTTTQLILVLAHNQCILFDLETHLTQEIVCDQKCMLYSARILDFNREGSSCSLGNVLVGSGTIYNQVILWSAASGEVYTKLEGHQGVIFNISYLNGFLFSVSDDRSINVWTVDIEKVNEERTTVKSSDLFTRFYGHDARVWKCEAFVDKETGRQYACSIGEDLNCCLWSLEDKSLIYRFKAMRKGSKNIWSLCVNRDKLEILTGWADGGLRKFELKNYLKNNRCDGSVEAVCNTNVSAQSHLEWSLNDSSEKDYVRDMLILNERILCCTNLGCLYSMEATINRTGEQRLLFKSGLLANYNVMAKLKLNANNREWCVVIGSLKGFIYKLIINIGDDLSKDQIQIECMNSLSIEEDLGSIISSAGCSSKISSLVWSEYTSEATEKSIRYFLNVCFGFLNGLMHVYELVENQLVLIGRLYLPECKHRWLTSFAVLTIDEETILVAVGDKCGNLYVYSLVNMCSFSELDESLQERSGRLRIVEAIQSFKALVKDKLPISAIYSKRLSAGKCQIICCCKDGFYRVFEYCSDGFGSSGDEEQEPFKCVLKYVNKYQINSYVDLIESFVFDSDLTDINECGDEEEFDLEQKLRLALCFYGDKFLLWNFQLNRALFEFKCGGANRSWDYDLHKSLKNDTYLFRLIYLKDHMLCEFSSVLSDYEIRKPSNQPNNNFSQIFHGNTITVCKNLDSTRYVLTGGEDTQLILTSITDNAESNLSLYHQIHVQGHESVVRCIDYCDLETENERLLVSAGGMANIKLWRIHLEAELEAKESIGFKRVTKISHLYDFKRFKIRKETPGQARVKPWLYVDLEKNPDIRFMDVVIFKSYRSGDSYNLCFACSDGAVRVFSYKLSENRLYLTNKFSYNKCLLCIKHVRGFGRSQLLGFGTDGHMLVWQLTGNKAKMDEEVAPERLEGIHQSGVNAVDIWRECEESEKIVVASVGDDTRLSLIELDLSSGIVIGEQRKVVKDMAHSSAIVGVKFLAADIIVTVSKDQRLIVWKFDLTQDLITPIHVRFINVSDASSMEAVKLTEPCQFRITVVGVGIEIVDLKLTI